MEKLQLALEKARRQRETMPAPQQPAEPAKPVQVTAPKQAFRDTAELWHALHPIKIDRRNLSERRVMSMDSDSDGAHHFDLLRTKTLLQMRKSGWRRLAITSPTMNCGKTTTAANLALGFTRQPDKNAILLEMDLRRPSMSGLLGFQPEFGVGELLNGAVSFSSQAVRVGDNVALSLNAGPSRDTSQLLMRDSTARQLDAIESAYQPDIMIFDLPPMLASDDTTAFLKNVDCTLLIAGAESSTVSQVDACEREIAEHTNVLGVVLNKCRFVEDDSSYGYPSY